MLMKAGSWSHKEDVLGDACGKKIEKKAQEKIDGGCGWESWKAGW